MKNLVPTPEQEAEAQPAAEFIGKKAQEEALQMARLLASKPDAQLLGASEFEIREWVPALGEFARLDKGLTDVGWTRHRSFLPPR